MENVDSSESKERILNASIRLFSTKGFDATRVYEIADAANVNKALIYYYFRSKEAILDYIVHSLREDAASITMDFVRESIVEMIADGRLDIEPDRLHFVNEGALGFFLHNAYAYLARITDFVLENRLVVRILMLESLKHSKHQSGLFRLFDVAKDRNYRSLPEAIRDADQDIQCSGDMVTFGIFFLLVPIFSFAAYFDDYRTMSRLSSQELRDSFLRSYMTAVASLIAGRDILLRNENERGGAGRFQEDVG